MKTKELEEAFESFCKAKKLKNERSHFIYGNGSKYITAPVGSFFIQASDVRAGNGVDIFKNVTKGGATSNITGFMSKEELYYFIKGMQTNLKKPNLHKISI